MKEVVEKIFRSGRLDRHYDLLFERGSHVLQKHKAESICKLINIIIVRNQVKQL